jgi:hypothetical protein
MILTLKRFSDDGDTTLGALFVNLDVSQELACFTVEDQKQTKKVYGETRIPAGVYRIKLRKRSPMASRYDEKYKHINHKGMLWLQDVEGFEWIYIHVGRTDDHTEGCILVNGQINSNHTGDYSVNAYERIYPMIKDCLDSGEDVFIEVMDL